ncbi:hypothetical protein ASE92_18575 [Pedobacter sp. Leaf41]|jgi:uncharacterized protein YdhG (YjbR/CyaY superfamily)|uniref:iron chaperone n=1 Tax=Pedobacter sp. Leaf41 TaxID=1736218 RepID=UPI00070339FC|nr:DUF1801 domain-containing protein [Pedobacter sp. Leaf41]KQN32598.1 hypothetical protein ASE92_18575 [Pedobacter sp. Leaf41]RZK65204.1 MAG: hypothetical protein EOO95_09045 [Pedobacter sp.]
MSNVNPEIDKYIAKFPTETQEKLQLVRETIKEAAPEAKEKISYAIPTFDLYGNLVHYAGYKTHIGFYPGNGGIEAYKDEISIYKSAKGSVQFPLDKPLPLDLISRITKFSVIQNLAKAKLKSKK